MKSALVFVATILFRILPHPANLTPMGGASVWAGRSMSKVQGLVFVLLTAVFADVLLSKIQGLPLFTAISFFVYAGFLAHWALGLAFTRFKGGSILAAFLGAVIFFLISNFGVWMVSGMYAPTTSGLASCYLAAIPFFKNTLLGNLLWTPIFVLGGAMLEQVQTRQRSRGDIGSFFRSVFARL